MLLTLVFVYLSFLIMSYYLQVDGGTNLSIKMSWSQKLTYNEGEFFLDIPFTFPEYVTPAVKKISKREKIYLSVDAGTGTEVLFKRCSHQLKVWFYSDNLKSIGDKWIDPSSLYIT